MKCIQWKQKRFSRQQRVKAAESGNSRHWDTRSQKLKSDCSIPEIENKIFEEYQSISNSNLCHFAYNDCLT